MANELNVINSCYSNLNCKDCYILSNMITVKPVVNKRKMFEVFEHFKNKGFNKLTFMGGEPLLDTYRLLDTVNLAKNYFDNITIITNGILLSEWFAKELIDAGVNKFTFNVLGIDDEMLNSVAGIIRKVEIPVDTIKYVNNLVETIIYVPLFKAYENEIITGFNDLLDKMGVDKITFIATEQKQFETLNFYQNIKISSQLLNSEEYFEIYDTSKYQIGFLDIFKYIKSDNNYYLFPDLEVRTSLFHEDSIYEII